jgi:hypothetical protein
MVKEALKVVSAEDVSSLNQYVRSSEDSFVNMEKAYKKKDSEMFNKAKANLIQLQKTILDKVK